MLKTVNHQTVNFVNELYCNRLVRYKYDYLKWDFQFVKVVLLHALIRFKKSRLGKSTVFLPTLFLFFSFTFVSGSPSECLSAK